MHDDCKALTQSYYAVRVINVAHVNVGWIRQEIYKATPINYARRRGLYGQQAVLSGQKNCSMKINR